MQRLRGPQQGEAEEEAAVAASTTKQAGAEKQKEP
jgi:hypothetical protein